MDYNKHYNLLVEKAKNRELIKEEGYEIHHIIPKCFGGSDEPDNLIKLTYREHFIAHILLYKMQTEKRKIFQMLKAIMIMGGRMHSNSHSFSRAKIDFGIRQSEMISGENHPMYGTSRTGEKNPFYGKKHTEESKKKMSEISKNLVTAKRLDTGERVKVTKEEFDSDANLVGSTSGNTLSRETKKKISENNGKVGLGKVATFDIIDKEFKLVPKDEYYNLRGIRYFGTNSKIARDFKANDPID